MQHDLVIQQPDVAHLAPGRHAELLLLFHGVGASARDLQPLAEALTESQPDAWVVCLQAPQPSDFGHALGATVSLQRFSGLGHGIGQRVLNAALALLAA